MNRTLLIASLLMCSVTCSGCSQSQAQQETNAKNSQKTDDPARQREEAEKQFANLVRTNDNTNSLGSINVALSMFYTNSIKSTNGWRSVEQKTGIKLGPMDMMNPFRVFDVVPSRCDKVGENRYSCRGNFTLNLKGVEEKKVGVRYIVQPSWMGVPEVTDVNPL